MKVAVPVISARFTHKMFYRT